MPDIRANPELFDTLPKYEMDEEVELGCKGCGKCCSNREDLLLTPYDIFRIAKYLGRTPGEILNRYCEGYIGQQSHLPVVRMKPTPPYSTCPFLRNKRCGIHAVKPSTCRLFPFARAYRYDVDGQYDKNKLKPMYVLNEGCGANPKLKKLTVREWVGDAASEEGVAASVEWADCTYELSEMMRSATKEWPDSILSTFHSIMAYEIYEQYDTAKPFLAQFDQNRCKIRELYLLMESTQTPKK